ncbi:MAG: CPBP family intramembrane metalloprotease [Candidatus Eremiobacteraeota bacterium]|nr:CPBP family intramembrane metalloprotease [Candidatus Eremiobacteraeota bacterium]
MPMLPPWMRALAYLTVVAVLVIALMAAFAILHLRPGPGMPALALAFVSEILLCIIVVAVALLARRFVDRRDCGSLGFSFRTAWLRLLGFGMLFGAGMQCFVLGLDAALGFSHLAGHADTAGAARTIMLALPLFIVAALAEEMSIRGYVFQNLWEQWGFLPAMLATATLFAALHLSNPNARAQLGLTLLGLAAYAIWACWSIVWTKSLWLALGCHFTWNLFEGPVLGFPVSGIDMPAPTALTQKLSGPAWFTGGAFGPEAGLSSILALCAGFAVLRVLYRRGTFARLVDTRGEYARDALTG